MTGSNCRHLRCKRICPDQANNWRDYRNPFADCGRNSFGNRLTFFAPIGTGLEIPGVRLNTLGFSVKLSGFALQKGISDQHPCKTLNA